MPATYQQIHLYIVYICLLVFLYPGVFVDFIIGRGDALIIDNKLWQVDDKNSLNIKVWKTISVSMKFR
jgi:hypothetical protein